MKKFFFLPLLILAITVQSQTNDTSRKSGRPRISINADSITIKLQRMKDSVDRTLQDVQFVDLGKKMEEFSKQVDKQTRKEKNKAVIYIVIGVGMLLVLIIGLRRRAAEKRS